MPRSSDLFFVSSNRNKYSEARDISAGFGIRLGFIRCALEEIQSDSIRSISKRKARDAFEKFARPVLVEDDGLFIDALGGFPGPFSSYAFETIGNKGIMNLLGRDRQARFVSVVSYRSKLMAKSFEAEIHGRIAASAKGRGWGYDPIFVPDNMDKTFAQITDKNAISHRFGALKRFSRWYLRTRGSGDR